MWWVKEGSDHHLTNRGTVFLHCINKGCLNDISPLDIQDKIILLINENLATLRKKKQADYVTPYLVFICHIWNINFTRSGCQGKR